MASLNVKSFSALVTDQVAAIQARSNQLIDFAIGSVLRAFVESNAGVVLWLESLIIGVLAVTRAATSKGSDLDSFVNDFGITRLPGVASSGVVTFSRFSPVIQVLVDVGTQIQTSDGSQKFVVIADTGYASYSTALAAYIIPGDTASLDVPVQSLEQSNSANVTAGTITVMTQALIGVDFINNAAPTLSGQAPESDKALRKRFVAYIASLSKATKAAIAYAILAVQTGITYTIIENLDKVTGAARYGYFYVVIDDGSGNPPASLLAAVHDSIDAYRAASVQFDVFAPNLVYAAVAMTITTAPTYDHATLTVTVANALTDHINALTDGSALIWASLISVALGIPGVTNVSGVTINGSPADISVGAASVIRASTVTVI